MTGDNRSLSLGPNNSTSFDLRNHMKVAGIPIVDAYMNNFSSVLCRSDSSSYEIMDPSEYDLLVMPIKNEEGMQS